MKRAIAAAESLYYQSHFTLIANDTRATWKLLNEVINKRKKNFGLNREFCIDNSTTRDPSVILTAFKEGMERKGLRVNMGKTKIMKCQVSSVQAEDSGKWPCGCVEEG